MKDWLGRGENRLALILILVGAVLRAAWLTHASLWSDEALTLVVSRSEDFWGLLRKLESAPPLHFLLMRGWLKLFADPLLGLRSFSLLCGVASLWVFFNLAESVDPKAARVSLFIAAFSSYWVHSSQDGRFYSLFLLLSLLPTLVLWRLREKDSLKLWTAYVLLAGLGLYTHYFMLFLVLAQAGYIAISRLITKRSLLPGLAAFSGLAVLYLPWLPSLAAQASQRHGATLVVERLDLAQVGFILGTMFADLNFLGLMLIPWIKCLGFAVLACLVISAWLLLRNAGSVRAFLSSWSEGPVFCLAHIVLGLAVYPLVNAFAAIPLVQPRYFVWLAPFVYLTIARHAAGGSARERLARYILEAVLLIGLGGYLASNRTFDPRLDLLAGEIRLMDRAAPVIHLHPYYYLPLRYHYLPEREHRLVPSHPKDVLDIENLPGYPGIQSLKDLPAAGPCLVVDPARRLKPSRAWPSSGVELSRLLGRVDRVSKEP